MRRAISLLSALVATVFLVLVLADASLVDRRAPSVVQIALSATAGDDRIAEPISSINVVFSEALRTETAEWRFHLEPSVPGALSWDGPTLIFTPSEPMPAATDFVVRVDPGFVDLAGNIGTTGVDEWAFATAGPPRVLVATPPDGAVGLTTDATIELEFDRLMDTTTVEAAIRLEPLVAFRATWSGDTVAIAFEPGLAFGTAYTLSIDTGATDTAGAHLLSPFATHFSTVSAGLNAQVIPADHVAGIALRSPIAVLFDGPIEPASAQGALTMTPLVGGDLEVVTPPAGPAASALVFTPASPLAENTTYTVSLATVVHRLGDPDEVAAGRTWSFTTGSQTESAQNQVAFVSDRSGVQNVWLVNPNGTNARQLTWELAPVTTFDFTGDGRRLVFAAGGLVGSVDVDGSDNRILTDDGFQELAPRLSPDETAVLLSRRDPSGAELGWWLVPTPWTFGDERQILASGAAPEPESTEVAPHPQPAFDASGRFAIVPVESGQLVVVDLANSSGGLAPTFETGLVAFGPPAWSEAAGAFVSTGLTSTVSTPVVHRVSLAGSATPIDGSPDKAIGGIAVDGIGRLVFVTDLGAGRYLVLLDPRNGPATDLTADQNFIDLGATFSPDGRRVVVARVPRERPDTSAGLWLIDIASRQLTRLTIDGTAPRWLP